MYSVCGFENIFVSQKIYAVVYDLTIITVKEIEL